MFSLSFVHKQKGFFSNKTLVFNSYIVKDSLKNGGQSWFFGSPVLKCWSYVFIGVYWKGYDPGTRPGINLPIAFQTFSCKCYFYHISIWNNLFLPILPLLLILYWQRKSTYKIKNSNCIFFSEADFWFMNINLQSYDKKINLR